MILIVEGIIRRGISLKKSNVGVCLTIIINTTERPCRRRVISCLSIPEIVVTTIEMELIIIHWSQIDATISPVTLIISTTITTYGITIVITTVVIAVDTIVFMVSKEVICSLPLSISERKSYMVMTIGSPSDAPVIPICFITISSRKTRADTITISGCLEECCNIPCSSA